MHCLMLIAKGFIQSCEIPLGLENKMSVNKVCRLKNSLYCLKQSHRTLFDRFTKAIKKFGFSKCQADHALLVKLLDIGKITIIIVYVGDIILTRCK